MRKKTYQLVIVSNANGTVSSNRTYQDLLKTKETNKILKIFTAELYKVNPKRN
jgi:histidinol phosphatase-like enzyme